MSHARISYYRSDERQKTLLKRKIKGKENILKRLESQHDQLYDALEKENQADLQNCIQLTQRYQHMANDAIRQVYI